MTYSYKIYPSYVDSYQASVFDEPNKATDLFIDETLHRVVYSHANEILEQIMTRHFDDVGNKEVEVKDLMQYPLATASYWVESSKPEKVQTRYKHLRLNQAGVDRVNNLLEDKRRDQGFITKNDIVGATAWAVDDWLFDIVDADEGFGNET